MDEQRPEVRKYPVCIAHKLKPEAIYQMGSGYDFWVHADEVEKLLIELQNRIETCAKSLSE